MNRKFLIVINLLFLFLPVAAQDINIKEERSIHQTILKEIKKDIQKNYYDPTFHGVDLEANFKKTSELINKSESPSEMSDLINRFCLLLDDSHTAFSPPTKQYSVDYGWELTMIGDNAFVTGVDDESDAYKKGVRVGDRIYMLDGFIPNRAEFRTLMRYLNVMQPRRTLEVLIVKPNGKNYKIKFDAKILATNSFITPTRRDAQLAFQKYEEVFNRRLHYDKIPGLSVLKMPSFDLSKFRVGKMIDQIGKNEAMILDLRGNHGGYFFALDEMVGNFFNKEVNAGKIIERAGTKTYSIKPKVKNPYNGKLVVLIDNSSASAAEIFARIVQIEKRGTVIGDQSAGAVMQSIFIDHSIGLENIVFYGIQMTIADLEMSDGKKLEKVGVMPDEKIIPTAQDLVNKRDPVMARAAKILGFEITPEEAGKIFPSEYKKIDKD